MKLVYRIVTIAIPLIIITMLLSIKNGDRDKRGLVINEILVKNLSCNTDGQGNYYGWFELCNYTDNDIDMEGYGISNEIDNPYKFVIHDIIIGAGGFQLFYFDSKGNVDDNIHIPFAINETNSYIVLSNKDGKLIDRIDVISSYYNVSYGLSESRGDYYYFNNPSPNEKNDMILNKEYISVPSVGIEADKKSGHYSADEPLIIHLNVIGGENGKIVYTLDGSEPNIDSNLYNGKITIEPTGNGLDGVVLRARGYKDNCLGKEILTETYFFGQNQLELPSLYIIANSYDLFDKKVGMYKRGEIGALLDRYDKGYIGVDNSTIAKMIDVSIRDDFMDVHQNVRMKLRGGTSRSYMAQKSFELKADETIWVNDDIGANSIRLRTWGGGSRRLYEDSFVNRAIGNLQLGNYSFGFVNLFINGEYWGIYSIDSGDDLSFFKSYYNEEGDKLVCITFDINRLVAKDEYNMFGASTKKPVLAYGRISDLEEYTSFYNQLYEMDLKDDINYKEVSDKIDFENYTKYIIAEMYFANTDWPEHNVMIWHGDGDNAKWKFRMYDMDSTMQNVDEDLFDFLLNIINVREENGAYIIPLLFRKLWERQDYREYFERMVEELLETDLSSMRLVDLYNERIDLLSHDMVFNIDRMNTGFKQDNYETTEDLTYDVWKQGNQEVLYFLENREKIFRKQMDYWMLEYNGSMAE